jgi:hypothetical protein
LDHILEDEDGENTIPLGLEPLLILPNSCTHLEKMIPLASSAFITRMYFIVDTRTYNMYSIFHISADLIYMYDSRKNDQTSPIAQYTLVTMRGRNSMVGADVSCVMSGKTPTSVPLDDSVPGGVSDILLALCKTMMGKSDVNNCKRGNPAR